MIVTIDIKDGAYDKIIYFLNNFTDDVKILNRQEKRKANEYGALSKKLDEGIRNLKVVNQKGADEMAIFIKKINQRVGDRYRDSDLFQMRDEYLREKGLM